MRRPLLVLATLALAGCGVTEPGRPPDQLAALPRALTANETRVSQAANQFALTLFRRLSQQQPDFNVFVSPLSVSFSLGMTMNGADTQTLDEMRATLGFGGAALAEINEGYRGLLALETGLDPSTTFEIANSVWHRSTLAVHQSFVDVVKSAFEAEVQASPFDQTTITQVNNWVSAKTNGRIPTILDFIAQEHVMFLINAIYFKGSWRDRFDGAATATGDFRTIDGSTQRATLMHREKGEGKIRHAFVGNSTVGELSYGNGAFVMTLVIPEFGGTVNDVAASLDTAKWTSMITPLREIEGEVILPKFRLSYERELAEDLKALGMVIPFARGGADFTRMSPAGRDLFIAFVKHKSFVDVNEEGTEAAAVTNTGIGIVSLPPGIRANKPFIFVIRERFSGTILFMGKMVRMP